MDATMMNDSADDHQENYSPSKNDDDKPYWSETALDWFQRCDTTQRVRVEPTDPSSAAQSFVVGDTSGIAFLDEALLASKRTKNRHVAFNSMIEISGSHSAATTGTLLSLAARFVVATRPSKFPVAAAANVAGAIPNRPLPQVVLVDSLHDISIERLVSMVRGMLLLDSSTATAAGFNGVDDETEVTPAVIDLEINNCLRRIHFIFAHETTTAVAALEALKCRLSNNDAENHPVPTTLLLWDGFLASTVTPDATARMEVLRQLGRLWREQMQQFNNAASKKTSVSTSPLLLVVLSSNRPRLENKHVTSRIRLEEQHQRENAVADEDNEQQRYVATVGGKQFEFTIGMAGVLSLL